LRAGLLSESRVIERLNAQFVCTWTLVADARRRSDEGDRLSTTIASNWEFPLDVMFISPEGDLVTKLNSFHDLKAAHPDVGHPPEGRGRSAPHIDTFLQHVDRRFPWAGD
jgi:hypothetical protein